MALHSSLFWLLINIYLASHNDLQITALDYLLAEITQIISKAAETAVTLILTNFTLCKMSTYFLEASEIQQYLHLNLLFSFLS